jgi:dipeptidyl aminopeptidase/acylaminoacyl peptidase
MRLHAFTFAFLVALGPTAVVARPTQRPFTLQDLYRLKTVGSPVISPDGRWVVYTVKTTALETSKSFTNLWRVDAEGKDPTRLTTSDAVDDQPTFSPDGKTLAFISTRSGEPQLYLMATAGGEPEKRTSVPGGVGGPVFSPDGKRIALQADVFPECGADEACNKRLDDAAAATKAKVHLADNLLYRHWDSWKDGKRSHLLIVDLTKPKAALRDLTPGPWNSPVFSLGGSVDYAFSPDGKELAFTSNHDPDPEISTNADLFTVPVDGSPAAWKAPRNLTAKNEGWDGQPSYTADGKTIVYRRQVTRRYESDRFRLAAIDRATGGVRDLLESFDNWITSAAPTADGKRVVFAADVKGRTPLMELDLASGAVRTISNIGTVDAFRVAPDGTWAVVARRQVGAPGELYRVSLDPKAPKEVRLTSHNADVANEVDIRPAEEVSVPGAGGKPVQVWIVKPHDFDPAKKYPVILNIHGGPQMQFSDAFRGDYQVYPGAGYLVAFANPHGSSGQGQDYTAAISGDWTGKVMEDLRGVTEWLRRQPYVDPKRMGAMGWSWGGYAIMWIEGHNDQFGFTALASMMGLYDLRGMYSATEELWFPHWDLKGAPWEHPALYKEQSPSEYVPQFKTPCLVITGEKDFRVPYVQSLEFFTDLQRMKVPSRLLVFPNAGHWPAWHEMAIYYDAHLDWFHRYLGGGAAPYKVEDMVRGTAFEAATKK